MSSTVGDYLFSRLAAFGVRSVLGHGGGTIITPVAGLLLNAPGSLFVGSVQRNGLAYSDLNYHIGVPHPSEIGSLVVSSQPDDLAICYYRGSLMFPAGPVVYVVEHQSAQFQSTSNAMSRYHFAASTVLNSPSTAASQINRVLEVMWRERKPVYIGLCLVVAGQPMPDATSFPVAPQGHFNSSRNCVGIEDEDCADAAIAMACFR